MIFRRTLCESSLVLILASALSGCEGNQPTVADTPPPPVSVSHPVSKEVIEQDDYEGRIGAAESVEIRARVRGHLQKVAFQPGEIVKKDALLYEIDPRSYQAALDAANAQVKAAEASLQFAKAEYSRIRGLVSQRAASREELDVWAAKQIVAAGEVLKAKAAVEQAQLDLDFTKVKAPVAGKMSRTQVDVGNLINAGGGETLLANLVTIDPMYVYFEVPERKLQEYRQYLRSKRPTGGAAEPSLEELKIPVYVGLEGKEGYPYKGVIDYADPRVNPSTGTKEVRGVLSNAARTLDAGMRARVRIPVSDPQKSVLITERAVANDQNQKFVYVVNDQNVVERRDVRLGRVHDGMQVVLAGVKPEDWVVVNGIQRVRDGAKVAPQPIAMPGTSAEKSNQVTKS